MVINESDWSHTRQKLHEVLDERAATTVIAALPRETPATKADVDARFDAFETRLDHRFTALRAEIRGEMAEGFSKIDRRFEKVNDKFEAVNDKFEAMNEKFDAVNEKFDAVNEKFETMNEKFGQIDRRFGEIDRRFGEIDRRFGEMHEKFGVVRAEVERSTKSLIKWVAGLVLPTLATGIGVSAAITAAIVG